jgi:hypothetical protein
MLFRRAGKSQVGGGTTGDQPLEPRVESLRIMAAAFSAIMIVGALVLAVVTAGMTDASMTRRPASPLTFSWESTTAIGSSPILQVPTM